MNKKPKKRLVNTLGEVAERYGVSLDTLNGWIDTEPTLATLVKPYKDGKKLIYPPSIIDSIYKTLGEP